LLPCLNLYPNASLAALTALSMESLIEGTERNDRDLDMDKDPSRNIPSLVATPGRLTPTRRLRRREASGYLKTVWGIERSPATLAKLFCLGGGPVACKDGRIPLYDPVDLDEWAQSRFGPKLRSSSDRGGAA
jgi:hypothetical protein